MKHAAKTLPKAPRKKPGKPEVELTLLPLKKHLEAKEWSMTIIEAKANFSEESGRYTWGAVEPGFPDLSGNMPTGLAVFIEVKAPGKRSTIRPAQREFLLRKIATNCFAICCDSIEYFERVFGEWQKAENKKALLLRELPELAKKWRDDMDADLWFDED